MNYPSNEVLTKSTIYLGIIMAIGTLGFLIKEQFWTHTGAASVLSYHYTTTTVIEKAQVTRKYGRSTVPSCAWDELKTTSEECFSRNDEGDCVMWLPVTEYDYSVLRWGKYLTQDTTVFNNHKVLEKTNPYQNLPNFRVKSTKTAYFVTLMDENGAHELKISPSMYKHVQYTGKLVTVRIRDKSGKIIQILK